MKDAFFTVINAQGQKVHVCDDSVYMQKTGLFYLVQPKQAIDLEVAPDQLQKEINNFCEHGYDGLIWEYVQHETDEPKNDAQTTQDFRGFL